MRAVRVALCILAASAALAQTGGIFERLRSALAASGQGNLAVEELEKKNFARVEEILAEEKPSGRAETAELLSLEGAVTFLEGKMSAAVEKFRQSAQLAPLRDTDNFTLAMAMVDLGNDAEARELLDRLTRKHPGKSIYVYWLGRLAYDQHRYAEAVETLQKATELDPNSSRAWDSLGLAFDMQGRMEHALAAFQKAATLNRTQARPSPWPPDNLGYLLLRMDRPGEAETVLRESIRYDATLARAHYHLGRTLEKEGQDTSAVDEYVKAVSIDKSSTGACYSLALLYRKLHRDEEAAAMFAEYRKRKQAPNGFSSSLQ